MEIKSLTQFVEIILLRKISFLLAFFVIFTLSYATLSWLDFLPEPVDSKKEISMVNAISKDPLVVTGLDQGVSVDVLPETISNEEFNAQQAEVSLGDIYPVSMYIKTLDRQINILNPTSRNIADLDAALLKGAVRHPDSATLDRNGTVFILGHSSYLPVVNNKAFQAFNDIQKLKWGDLIEITASEGKYVYRVDKVYRAKAQNVTVPIAGSEKRLYLATCNSFGSTDDRYIVEALLIETKLF